ncbi:hypothetical protein [Flavobacterium sp. HNIBRBA15423]|uniref:hypothetical protein n=1 Tax=Flavobacterium sp. HNIBRBA15423 TaxID=3458683 RepID=UPI00404416A9
MNKAIEFIGKIFGVGNPISDLLNKVIPDKSKRDHFEHELKMKLLDISQKEFEDMDNARKMQIEALKQNDTFSKRFVYYLSAVILFNSVMAGFLAIFFEFPPLNREFVNQYFNFSFIAGSTQVISFYFGRATKGNNTI